MNEHQKGTAVLDGAATDEVLASSPSILSAGAYGQGIKGLQQFYSPPEAARLVRTVIGDRVAVLDPTAGDGSLLKEFETTLSFGVEIDKDQIKNSEGSYTALQGDFQHYYTLIKKVREWGAIVANPPFGLQWEDPSIRDGKPTNSTVMTFIMVNRLLSENGQYAFICGKGRYERQIKTLPEHSTVYAVIRCDDLFEGTREPCVILFGIHDSIRATASIGVMGDRQVPREMLDLTAEWVVANRTKSLDSFSRLQADRHSAYHIKDTFKALHDEYQRRLNKRIKTREFDAQLFNGNHIQWMPSAFAQIALRTEGLLDNFYGLNGQPLTYFAQNERLWFQLSAAADRGLLTLDPRISEAVSRVLGDIHKIRIPLYDLKPQQRLGFLDDIDSLTCIKDDPSRKFKAGEIYRIDAQTKTIVEKETRMVESKKKPGELEEKTFEKMRKVMSIVLSGHGAAYTIYDGGDNASQNIAWLIEHFDIPNPGEVANRHPIEIAECEKLVRTIMDKFQVNSAEWEKKNPVSKPFKVEDFQVKDIARLLFKTFGLLTWEQGLGKTVGILAFAASAWERGAKKKLLIVTAGDLIPQTVRECERFLGITPTIIKTHGQAHKIAKHLRQGGEGIYIIHYEGMAISGTLRKNLQLPVITIKEWTEERLVKGTDQYGYFVWMKGEGETAQYLTTIDDIKETLSLAGFEHLDEDRYSNPSSRVYDKMTELGWVQQPSRSYIHKVSGKRCLNGYRRPRKETIMKKLTSRDVCPACEADTRNGWGGLFCNAEKEDGSTCGYAHFSVRMKPIAALLSTAFHDAVVCLDEITYIQGNDSKRSKAMRGVQARFRLGTSGTPIKNYVDQLFWPLAWCLGYSKPWFPYDYAGGKTRFEGDFCVIEFQTNGRRKEARKVLPDVTNLSRFWRMLACCTIRRRQEETGIKLVDIYYHEVKVPVSVGQAGQFKEWLQKLPHGFPAFFAEKYPDAKVVKAMMHEIMAPMLGLNWKLDWAATLPQADQDYKWTGVEVGEWTPANLRALELCMALVKQGRKVLFGSNLVAEGQWIAEKLQSKGVNAVHIVDDSGTTVEAKKRAKRVYDFQTDEKVQVFCAGMKAIRLGHNLDAADAVVINGLDFDYETKDQFIKRVRRLTSKRDIDVFVLLPVDEQQQTITSRKWTLLNMKGNAADLALDGRLIVKAEQEISEAEMIRELQEKGFRVTDNAIEDEDVEAAWAATPMIDEFNGAHLIPPRPAKADVADQLEISDEAKLEMKDIIAETEEMFSGSEDGAEMLNPNEPDEIDLAEAELAAHEEELVASVTNSDDSSPSDESGETLPSPDDGSSPSAPITDDETRNLVVESVEPEAELAPAPADGSAEDEKEAVEVAIASPNPSVQVEEEPVVTSGVVAPALLDPATTLKNAKGLLDLEIISQEEFDQIKTAQLKLMGVTT